MEQELDTISVFSQLKTTLSKLYPIERWAASTTANAKQPFAPRFCWEFFRADPEVLARLGQAFRDYKGTVSWVFGPPSGSAICVVAVKDGQQFVGYPPLGRSDASAVINGTERESLSTREFIDQAIADVPNLCSHLERVLELGNLPSKSFDSRLIAPSDPPFLDSAPSDFVERGMHVAWIVHRTSTDGQRGETVSGTRRMLHFSVTNNEWRTIHTDVLDKTPVADGISHPDTRSFPLLSRISEYESVYFRNVEVVALREECLRARSSTSTPLAIRGLDKILLLCNWAQRMAADIVLKAP